MDSEHITVDVFFHGPSGFPLFQPPSESSFYETPETPVYAHPSPKLDRSKHSSPQLLTRSFHPTDPCDVGVAPDIPWGRTQTTPR